MISQNNFSILLWGLAAVLAAFIIVLESAIKRKEASTVLKTKEWWILWGINAIIAFILIYAVQLDGRVSLTFYGFFGAILGYSLILHANLFTIPTLQKDNTQNNIPIGPEFILKLFDQWLQKGIDQSIIEQKSVAMDKWLQTDFNKLIYCCKNDLAVADVSDLAWMDKLLDDTTHNPGSKDDNARSLFLKIYDLRGLRGIRYVLKQSKLH